MLVKVSDVLAESTQAQRQGLDIQAQALGAIAEDPGILVQESDAAGDIFQIVPGNDDEQYQKNDSQSGKIQGKVGYAEIHFDLLFLSPIR
jgi:hypothetical protein